MEEMTLHKPELIGRDAELAKLKQALDNAIAGKGSTIFIAGEAGIGKTRLVSELISDAEKNGAQIIRGWCLAESLEPLMPVKTALRDAGLFHLISGDPPPLVVSTYLMNDAGMLIAKAEREQSELDSDIFAGMLQAVGNFVKDSLGMMDSREGSGLNSLGYAEHTILIQSLGKLSLATVIKGKSSEFLIADINSTLAELGNSFDGWSGNMAAAEPAKAKISWLVNSGKYDGRFLVDDPKLRQENLFDNILLGLQRVSSEKTLLLFMDDMQWADPTSLNLLHYIARNSRKNRMLVIGTYRPEDVTHNLEGKSHPLEMTMQNMSREDLLDKIELKRLGRDSTEIMINDSLGATRFEKNFYDKIHKETEGTPLFVLEILKLLVEENAITRDEAGTWSLVEELDKLDLPSKVYDVVKRRLDRLMRNQREILECAAVIGEEFSTDVLEKTSDIKKVALLKNLGEIQNVHKLLHYLKNKYRFDHAKIREVLYTGIGEELRREYHRLTADTIAEIHKDEMDMIANELAYHYYEAGDVKAGEFLIKAGNMARERYANEEAIRLYKNATEVMCDERKSAALEHLADVQILIGDYGQAIENLKKSKETTEDNGTKARVLRKAGEVFEKKGDYDASLTFLSDAKQSVEEETVEYGRICFTEGHTYWRKAEFDKAMCLFQEGIMTLEKAGGEPKDIGNMHRAIGNIHLSKAEYGKALEHYEKSLAVMENIDERYGVAAALNNTGNVYVERGELDKALGFYERSLEIRKNIGDMSGVATSLNNIGYAYHQKGELIKELDFHNKSLEIFTRIGDKRGIAMSLNNIGEMHTMKGELEKALEFYERSLGIYDSIGDKATYALLLGNVGGVHHFMGESEKALEIQKRCLALSLDIGNKWVSVRNSCFLAETYLELGNITEARELVDEGLGTAKEIGAKVEEAMFHRVKGMIARKTEDWKMTGECFEEARKILEDAGNRNELLILAYEYGLLLKAMGEGVKAKEHLEKTQSEFKDVGNLLWAGKCGKALKELKI